MGERNSHPGEASSDHYEAGELEQLVADYVERLNRGETIDKQAIHAEHPALAEEIIEQLEVFINLHLEGS